jgi:phage RecT family recombinase
MKLIIPDTHADTAVLTLRGHITPERMTQVALAAIRRTPALLQCRVDSLLEALTLCMEAGLEPDGRNAHLTAQGDAVRVIFDWKGLIALGRRCGVRAIHADVVCENDQFGVSYSGGADLAHQIDYKKPRGDVYAAYCYYIIDGDAEVAVMTLEDIERTRMDEAMSDPDNSALADLWERDWEGMAKRTVLYGASLHWPLDPAAAAVFKPMQVLIDPDETPAAAPMPGGGGGSDATTAFDESPPAQPRDEFMKPPEASPLEALRHFMTARHISEASMLDYLKEEGRIADFITRLADVPEPVIDDVVTSWVEMMEEEL